MDITGAGLNGVSQDVIHEDSDLDTLFGGVIGLEILSSSIHERDVGLTGFCADEQEEMIRKFVSGQLSVASCRERNSIASFRLGGLQFGVSFEL
jgi:hypothetical protein